MNITLKYIINNSGTNLKSAIPDIALLLPVYSRILERFINFELLVKIVALL